VSNKIPNVMDITNEIVTPKYLIMNPWNGKNIITDNNEKLNAVANTKINENQIYHDLYLPWN
jgi:hypothetical protein